MAESIRFQQEIIDDISSKRALLVVHLNKALEKKLKTNLNMTSISNIDIAEFKPEILRFNVRTYEKLTKRTVPIEPIFHFVYGFLDSLDEENQMNIIRLYYLAKAAVMNAMVTHDNQITATDEQVQVIIDGLVETIGGAVFQVFGKDDFLEKLSAYALTMPVPDLTGLGDRPQDSKELTFVLADYFVLNQMMVITKLLIPIFGDLNAFFNTVDLDNTYKEFWSAKILSLLFDVKYEHITDKLMFYINSRMTEGSVTDKHIFGGVGRVGIKYKIFAKIIVKDLPNMRLQEDPSANIMTKISSTVNHGIKHPENTNDNVSRRFDNESEGSGDDERRNMIDIHIPRFVSSPHKRVLIQNMVNELEVKVLRETNVTKDEFDEACQYYMNYLVEPTIYNQSLITLLFQRDIYGSRSIKFVDYETFVKLIVMAQLVLAEMKVEPYLIHLMTVKLAAEEKRHISTTDASIGPNKASDEYRYLHSYFTYLNGTGMSDKWDDVIQAFCQKMLFQYYYNLNTSDVIYNKMGVESDNGSRLEYDHLFFMNVIKLIASVFKTRYETAK